MGRLRFPLTLLSILCMGRLWLAEDIAEQTSAFVVKLVPSEIDTLSFDMT